MKPKKLTWKRDYNEYFADTSKYNFHIQGYAGNYAVLVFNAKIKDNDKAYLRKLQAEFETLIEAKKYCENMK